MNTMHNRNKKEHRNIGEGQKRERTHTRWCRRRDGIGVGCRQHAAELVGVVSASLKAQGCRCLEAEGSFAIKSGGGGSMQR